MINKFRQTKFSNAIKEKMFAEMSKEKRRIGVREFAKKVGVSPATFNRTENGKTPDIETFFRLCFWMKRSPNDFYHYDNSMIQ